MQQSNFAEIAEIAEIDICHFAQMKEGWTMISAAEILARLPTPFVRIATPGDKSGTRHNSTNLQIAVSQGGE